MLSGDFSVYSHLLMIDNKELFVGNQGRINIYTKII